MSRQYNAALLSFDIANSVVAYVSKCQAGGTDNTRRSSDAGEAAGARRNIAVGKTQGVITEWRERMGTRFSVRKSAL